MNQSTTNKTTKRVQKITLIALFTAIAVIISIVDRLISSVAFAFLPMAKIGLANVVVLFVIYKFNFLDSLIVVVLKSVLVGLILGSIMSFVIGFSGSILSFAAMQLLKRIPKKHLSVIGVSVGGGFFHIVGQMLAILVIYKLGDVLILYGALLVLTSLITSILVGFIALKLLERLDRIN